MAGKTMLFALNAIQRVDPDNSNEDNKVIHEIAPGRVFTAADDKEAANLLRLGAVRDATKEEIAAEKARQEEEGEEAETSTIVASIAKQPPAKSAAKAGTGKAGEAAVSKDSTGNGL